MMRSFHIIQGSITDFSYPPNRTKSAIVNAANQSCIGGGGLDGAISKEGGTQLKLDRRALPLIAPGIRCPMGQARLTGPGHYGTLQVPYVIHAVGTNYQEFSRAESQAELGDSILKASYLDSLKIAQELKVEAIAFPLLSSGAYRAWRSHEDVIKIGIQTLSTFHGYPELKHIYVFAFGSNEFQILQKVTSSMTQALSVSSMTFLVQPTTLESVSDKFKSISVATKTKKFKSTDLAHLKKIEGELHKLIRKRNSNNKHLKEFRFPNIIDLASMEESEEYYAVPGMYGGFDIHLYYEMGEWTCRVSSWSRISGGSGQTHKITKNGTLLLEEGFV